MALLTTPVPLPQGIRPANSPSPYPTFTNYILDTELASAAGPGTGHDRLIVDGNFVASGTLNVTLLGGYDPLPNTSFQIVAATGTVTGTFFPINYPPGGNWSITYNSNNVTLQYLGLLPVELIDFNAQASKRDVLLSWRTASEIDNDYFEVGHSRDGTNFEAIGKIAGHGTTLEAREYQFVHRQPEVGPHYYRLRQVDVDGKSSLSKIVFLEHPEKPNSVMQVYPNPTNGNLTVEFPFNDFDTELRIVNGLGILIRVEQVSAGTEIYSMDVSSLPAGFYYIHSNLGYHLQFIKKQ
ncbi:MAG: T9SS type A sorting domain-containing protein [Saprospiraceae bacterium]|nr:T9SS type A sorting domain-containing protein [Saprospiraceae bacterium]